MDQQHQLFGLTIDPNSKRFLSETAKWGRFLSIMGFIMCGLLIIIGLFAAVKLQEASSAFGELGGGGPMSGLGPTVALIYILFAVLYFFPCLYLSRFSSQMTVAIGSDDQNSMTSAFENLKSMFKFFGILTIIVLSLWVLAILLVLLSI